MTKSVLACRFTIARIPPHVLRPSSSSSPCVSDLELSRAEVFLHADAYDYTCWCRYAQNFSFYFPDTHPRCIHTLAHRQIYDSSARGDRRRKRPTPFIVTTTGCLRFLFTRLRRYTSAESVISGWNQSRLHCSLRSTWHRFHCHLN